MTTRLILAILCQAALLSWLAGSYADVVKSTDQRLLEDLGAELLKPDSSNLVPDSDYRSGRRLLNQRGEDIGKSNAPKDERLSKVVGHMEKARSILERSAEAKVASTAQQEALKGLDAMIVELTERRNKCCGGQSRQSSLAKPGKKSDSANKAGKNPAESASSTTSSDADLSTDLVVAGELVKDLWGKLPQRQREQILQPLSEDFLPKYASEIETYFRALADPQRSNSGNP